MTPRPGDAVPNALCVQEPIATDAVVIGAGPVGLFQVFELGLQDIGAHVIDALPFVGGQPAQLYPDKPIYDIPGLPVCTGQDLVDALARQCAPFAPSFHLGQTVSTLERQPDGRFLLSTSAGTRLLAKTVFIAAGVGAFEPKRLKIDGLDRFEGTQVFHHTSTASHLSDAHVLLIGDDDHAVGFAVELAERREQRPRSVTLMHRRESLRASEACIARMREHCQAGTMRFVAGQMTGMCEDRDRLREAVITQADGHIQRMPVDALLVLQGLSPRLGPITGWGLAMEQKLLRVDTRTFSTSEPGIFAVGDINTYPGKRKLLVCGFHECALAAFGAAPIVHPTRPVQLLYTTSSTRLHALLGVSPAQGIPSSA